MKARVRLWSVVGFLLVVHAVALFAELFAPYDPTQQNRALPYAPPTPVHFLDRAGRFHLRPFVYGIRERPGELGVYEEDPSRVYPLRFFLEGAPRRIGGILPSRLHLFGVDEPGRVFLIGSDGFGRDQLSRLLHGGRLSLLAGLLAAALSLGAGLLLGTLAGFYGGLVDAVLMRGAELFLALPWLYLLLAVRAFLPLDVGPVQAFMLLVSMIGLIGWARPARLVRGVVMSVRQRPFVLAARGFGASNLYLMRRHVVPQTYGVLLTQGAVLVPQYILAEVSLSFLGLGVAEPAPSLGNLLGTLQQYHVLASCWWMWLPGFALPPIFLGYYALADLLHERAKLVAL